MDEANATVSTTTSLREFSSSAEKRAYAEALLRTLSFANVKFVRYLALDVCNNARCKAVPTAHLRKSGSVEYQVATAKVCFAGLPSFADAMQPETGLDAQDTVVLMPDLSTLRILPYSPKSALVLGNLHDQRTGLLSDLCCRGLLQSILDKAADEHQIGFNVGAELEVCLYDAKTNQPVDLSNYAHTTTLNVQEEFIADVHDQLAQQDIEVEMIHAESAPGQLEFVLAYQDNAVRLADNVLLARESIVAIARQHGLKAIFLPKVNPLAAGNGAHVHISMYDINDKSRTNLFVNQKSLSRRRQSFLLGSQSDISEMGKSFMEGILRHMPALLALTVPTTNSFRRVGPGCWTGSQVTWAFEDKESPLRVVANLHSQAWEHVEYKLCDSMANMYLALAGLLSAGMDGIAQKLDLRPSRHDDDVNSSETIALLPSTINESLEFLEQDELLNNEIPAAMLRGFIALRRAEADRAAGMSLEQEVNEALERA